MIRDWELQFKPKRTSFFFEVYSHVEFVEVFHEVKITFFYN